ncbi:MAG TPA: DNA alkylation repair protein [Gemmatimonadales bacterium]
MSETAARVRDSLLWLERHDSKAYRDAMLTRYAITAPKSYGVKVGMIQGLAKSLGKDHDLAEALWRTGWYEARMLASYVDDPAQVTSVQMDRWARDFDNWGICDTVCFVLFDKTPHAWRKVEQWSKHREEFVKRAAFALIASLALHDKRSGDEPFVRSLKFIQRGATDERNFVKKGVSWGLRVLGRRNASLNAAAVEVSRRLAESDEPAARSIGKEALRELTSPLVRGKLAAKGRRTAKGR